MSVMEKTLLSAFVFVVIAFGIAVLRSFRENKKMLNIPWYIKNVLKGINIAAFSLFGSPAAVRQKGIARADATFITVSKELHERALRFANSVMTNGDMVYNKGDEKRTTKAQGELGYCRRLFDCENFAAALKHYYDLYVARETTELGKGIPSVVIGYVTRNNHPHSIVEFIVEGKMVWHNCYPKDGSFEELDLTPDEQATIIQPGIG